MLKECLGASLVAQAVKNLPAMQEIWVQFLSQEDPLEKGMATHSSMLAWRIPWTEKPIPSPPLLMLKLLSNHLPHIWYFHFQHYVFFFKKTNFMVFVF